MKEKTCIYCIHLKDTNEHSDGCETCGHGAGELFRCENNQWKSVFGKVVIPVIMDENNKIIEVSSDRNNWMSQAMKCPDFQEVDKLERWFFGQLDKK